MENSDRLIDRLRLDEMFNNMYGLRTRSHHRELLSAYRYRNRTLWSQEEQQEINALFPKSGSTARYASTNPDFDLEQSTAEQYFSPQQVTSLSSELQYCKQQKRAMDAIYGTTNGTHRVSIPTNPSDESSPTIAMEGQMQQDTDSSLLNNMFFHSQQHNIEEKLNTVLSAKLPVEEVYLQEGGTTSNSLSNEYSSDSPLLMAVDQYLAERDLSDDQLHLATLFKEYFLGLGPVGKRKQPPPEAPNVLLTGDPGAGKSYSIDTVVELARIMGAGYVPTTSYNGIAAFMIDGTTLCSLLGISGALANHPKATHNVNQDKIHQIRQALHSDTMCLFIVDEVSTLDAPIIAMIDIRLQQTMQNTLPFGGVAILWVGDFNQLGPVKKTFLLRDMMVWASMQKEQEEVMQRQHVNATAASTSTPPQVNNNNNVEQNQDRQQEQGQQQHITPTQRNGRHHLKVSFQGMIRAAKKRRTTTNNKQKHIGLTMLSRYSIKSMCHRGCLLFSKVHRVHLSTQQRSDDEQHNSFVEKLAKGQKIQIKDILRYKPLSKDDINNAESASDWKYAPVLVSTNRERLDITQRQSILYAKDHGTYVFKWKSNLKGWVNKPSAMELPEIQDQNALFWQYFVPGAKAYLDTNVNNDLGLVNGSAVKCHSLVFSNATQIEAIRSLILGSDGNEPLPPGSEIILEEPPVAINVAIEPTLDGKNPSKRRQCQLDVLRNHSVLHAHDDPAEPIVIPIGPKKSSKSDSKKTYKFRSKSVLAPISTVESYNMFPLDLAFSMTIHKAQGRTISRVVLALTNRPSSQLQMKFAAIFVAISRVQHTDHMRILYHPHIGHYTAVAKKYFKYLTELHPDKFVVQFYSGFRNNNGPWNRDLALRSYF
jgi:hypothetical protein